MSDLSHIIQVETQACLDEISEIITTFLDERYPVSTNSEQEPSKNTTSEDEQCDE